MFYCCCLGDKQRKAGLPNTNKKQCIFLISKIHNFLLDLEGSNLLPIPNSLAQKFRDK